MNIQSTPSQRLFYAAHKERIAKFWPKPTLPAPPQAIEPVPIEIQLRPLPADLFKLAWEILEPVSSDKITIDEIKRAVCAHFGINHNELISPRRSPQFSRPRMVVMYLAKHLTSKSYPEIGRRLEDRDHTTILHGVVRIRALIKRDEKLAASVEYLMQKLGA